MKRKQYLQFLPVSSKTTARLLQTEAVWEVLTKIREKGIEGIKVDQIAKETETAPSTVYNALKELDFGGFVKYKKERRVKKVGRPEMGEPQQPRPGKSAKVYFEPCDRHPAFRQDPAREPENPWGDVVFSIEFNDTVGKRLIEEKIYQDLKKEWERLEESVLKFTKEIYRIAQATQELPEDVSDKISSVLPTDEICGECKRSHEGMEFIKATLFYIVTLIMGRKKFENLLKDLKLSK